MDRMYIELDKVESEGIRFDTRVELAPLPLGGSETVEVLEARLAGRAEPGDHGVEFLGELDGRLRLSCSRCLERFEIPLRVDVHLILVRENAEPDEDDAEMDARASLFFQAEDGRADLREIVREQIYLFLPLKPVCDESCRGLCPTCGANRNRLECACRSEEIDPRLAPLLEFKNRPKKR